MVLDTNTKRRLLGTAVLLAALSMLIAGETALKEQLRGTAFIVYWLACFGLTGVAFLLAFLDVRATRQRLRLEQKELLDATLKEIQEDAHAKQRRAKTNGWKVKH